MSHLCSPLALAFQRRSCGISSRMPSSGWSCLGRRVACGAMMRGARHFGCSGPAPATTAAYTAASALIAASARWHALSPPTRASFARIVRTPAHLAPPLSFWNRSQPLTPHLLDPAPRARSRASCLATAARSTRTNRLAPQHTRTPSVVVGPIRPHRCLPSTAPRLSSHHSATPDRPTAALPPPPRARPRHRRRRRRRRAERMTGRLESSA